MSTPEDLFELSAAKPEDETAKLPVAETSRDARRRESAGRWVVLKQVGEGSFLMVEEDIAADDRNSAVRAAGGADGDDLDAVVDGDYVAVPLASWKVQSLRKDIRIILT